MNTFNIFKILTVSAVVLAMSAHLSCAQISQADLSLVKVFVTAVDYGDEAEIVDAWQAISGKEYVIDYMRSQMPNAYYMYRVKGALYELEQARKSLEDLIDKGPSKVPGNPYGDKKVNKPLTNQEKVEAQNNQEKVLRQNNQDRVRVRPNKIDNLIDNRTKALSNPNQNRRSNTDILQGRRERALSQNDSEDLNERLRQ